MENHCYSWDCSCIGRKSYGNIEYPLISEVDQLSSESTVVIGYPVFNYFITHVACDIAIIVNIEPDHLDWHSRLIIMKKPRKH